MSEGWMDRVVVERNELSLKLNKLREFLDSHSQEDVNSREWDRMYIQEHSMSKYLMDLCGRIEANREQDSE